MCTYIYIYIYTYIHTLWVVVVYKFVPPTTILPGTSPRAMSDTWEMPRAILRSVFIISNREISN